MIPTMLYVSLQSVCNGEEGGYFVEGCMHLGDGDRVKTVITVHRLGPFATHDAARSVLESLMDCVKDAADKRCGL